LIEKRLFSRLQINSLVSWRLGGEVIEHKGIIVDLSEIGFSFLSDDYMDSKKGAIIELDLNIDDEIIKVLGKLRWVQKEKEGFRYGVLLISDKKNKYKPKIRTFYEAKKVGYFIFELTVYLKDVNLFGTGYFSRYFDWQGMAREEYFMTVRNYKEVMSSGIKLITKKAWVDYQNHCFAFDRLVMKIQNKNIKKFSFEMIFTYFNKHSGELVASGGQILVFSDNQGKLIPIPDSILEVISKHQLL